MSINKDLMFSSATDNWATPQEFFNQLNEEFHFSIDACADSFNHKTERYYTIEDDGLSKGYAGEVVFCNPPYGRAIGKWVKKFFDEVNEGGCELAVMLLPARTDTAWFHNYIYGKAEIRFVKGRIKFGGSKHNAPFPSMIVVFRSNAQSTRKS